MSVSSRGGLGDGVVPGFVYPLPTLTSQKSIKTLTKVPVPFLYDLSVSHGLSSHLSSRGSSCSVSSKICQSHDVSLGLHRTGDGTNVHCETLCPVRLVGKVYTF